MNFESQAYKIVDKMYIHDAFSQWLGIERVLIEEGRCILKMLVRKEMLNGFNILHGGITYSLADSCLAFASNTYGIQSVSIETSISYLNACKEGDVLTATSEQVSLTNRIGLFYIHITNQQNTKVAEFKGTVYRTAKTWDI